MVVFRVPAIADLTNVIGYANDIPACFDYMPIPVAAIDRIVGGIGVAVDVDACEDRVPGVGGEEASEDGIVIAGMEILEAVRRANDSLDRLLVPAHRGRSARRYRPCRH